MNNREPLGIDAADSQEWMPASQQTVFIQYFSIWTRPWISITGLVTRFAISDVSKALRQFPQFPLAFRTLHDSIVLSIFLLNFCSKLNPSIYLENLLSCKPSLSSIECNGLLYTNSRNLSLYLRQGLLLLIALFSFRFVPVVSSPLVGFYEFFILCRQLSFPRWGLS